MTDQLRQTSALLAGKPPGVQRVRLIDTSGVGTGETVQIGALVPVDLERTALGVRRSLSAAFRGQPLLQATLERLGRTRDLQSIVLLVATDERDRVEALLDRSRIGIPVEIEPTDGSPFGPERRAIGAARAFAPTSWRGGIGGMSVYDEVLCPGPMHRAMQARGLGAALLVAPDWPLVDVTAESGTAAVCARHRELPEQHGLVFTQAPPGLGSCVVGAALMEELSARTRLGTVGGLLVYQPRAPQHDPIARTANVQVDDAIGRSRVRATFDAARYRRRLEAIETDETATIVAELERDWTTLPDPLPRHLILELTTDRRSTGAFRGALDDVPRRPPLGQETARGLFAQLAEAGDAVVTLGGLGDPLLHERFDEVIRAAREAGIGAVHVRSELLVDRDVLDRLLAAGVDALSVDLHADTAETYRAMMGLDRFGEVIDNLEYLVRRRERLTDHGEVAALALPWIVPRLQRRAESLGDLEAFFDRWQAVLGTALIEGPPAVPGSADTLMPAEAPQRVALDELARRMTVYSDGTVPVSELDVAGAASAGDAREVPLAELWTDLCARRRAADTPGTLFP